MGGLHGAIDAARPIARIGATRKKRVAHIDITVGTTILTKTGGGPRSAR